jgi:hypothetical protein
MEGTSESPAISTRSAGIRYGIIMGTISIAYFLIFVITDMDMSKGLGRWGTSLIAIVIIYFAHKYFKDNGDGFMSYGQGVGIGFWVGLVSAVIGNLFTYIYVKFIDDGFIAKIREDALRDMEDQGQSDEQIEMAMKFVNFMTGAEALSLIGLFFGILLLVIIALIVSLITQKQRPETF